MAELRPICPKGGTAHLLGLPVAVKSHVVDGERRTYYRCTCGWEWTVCERVADRSRPVSGDEVLSVHEVLEAWDGKLTDLLEVKPE